MNYEDMSDFEIEVEVTKVLFPFVLDEGYEFLGSRDGFLYTKEDKREHKLSGNKLICTIKNYCNNPSDAWTIIVDNLIDVLSPLHEGGKWEATAFTKYDELVSSLHLNPLRAAMICFLMLVGGNNE